MLRSLLSRKRGNGRAPLGQDYEVIIAGAGPSGATLAYELARKGISVALLEKRALPRYKCCAGGISARTVHLLDIDIQELVENEINGAIITLVGKRPYYGHSDQTIMYTVRRDKFDYLLVKRAVAAGATVLQEHGVRKINVADKRVDVYTSTGDFRAKFMVGADGVNSIIARELGLRKKCLVAIETEVIIPQKDMPKWKSHVTLDLGRVPGYGWVFPKSDHLSIGIACHRSKAKDLKRHYEEFVRSLNLVDSTVSRRSGSLIPFCEGKTLATRGRAALLGDAAGLVDPLLGEGIYNAVLSAKLAAPVIEQSLLKNGAELLEYQKALEKTILPEMKFANLLSKALVRIPSIVFEVLNRDERIWRTCCRLLIGETDYTAIKQRLNALGGVRNFLLRI